MSKYSIGEEVRVLSYEEIKARSVSDRSVRLPSGCNFPKAMSVYCGNTYTI